MQDPILACLDALKLFEGEVDNFEWHPRGHVAKIDWRVTTSRGPKRCGLRASRRKATQDVTEDGLLVEREIRFLLVTTRVYDVPWGREYTDPPRVFDAPRRMQREVRVEDEVWTVYAVPRCAPYAEWTGTVDGQPNLSRFQMTGAITRTAGAAALLVIPDATSTAWGSPRDLGLTGRESPEAPW